MTFLSWSRSPASLRPESESRVLNCPTPETESRKNKDAASLYVIIPIPMHLIPIPIIFPSHGWFYSHFYGNPIGHMGSQYSPFPCTSLLTTRIAFITTASVDPKDRHTIRPSWSLEIVCNVEYHDFRLSFSTAIYPEQIVSCHDFNTIFIESCLYFNVARASCEIRRAAFYSNISTRLVLL